MDGMTAIGIEIGALVAVLGAMIGSFLNVCIHRMPRDESVVFPGSHCTACGKGVAWYDNVPILSWFILRGRCRHCGARFSFRYPAVEALTAAVFAGLYAKFGLGAQFFIYALFASGLIVVTFVDLDFRIIPDEISIGGIPVGFALSFANPDLAWIDSLAGIAVGGGFLLALGIAYHAVTGRTGLGGGDIKLLAAIGAFLGWKSVLAVILISSLIGALVGVGAMIATRSDTKLALPFGPFLAGAAVFCVFFGPALIGWYTGYVFGPGWR